MTKKDKQTIKHIEELPYYARLATMILAMGLLPFLLLIQILFILLQVLLQILVLPLILTVSIGQVLWITIDTLMVKPINKLLFRRTNNK